MALILNIETSTNSCSAALSLDGKLIDNRLSENVRSHASLLPVFIDDLLASNASLLSEHPLDAVAVSKGPGSYTGLRIGVSTAKGLAYGLGVPVIGVPTLELMAYSLTIQEEWKAALAAGAWACPMLDARRMEVYLAVYDAALQIKQDVVAEIVTAESCAEMLSERKLIFFGDGAEKCRTTITHENALFVENLNPSASYMPVLAEKYWAARIFEDTAYFEPFYLKDFVATVSRKMENVIGR